MKRLVMMMVVLGWAATASAQTTSSYVLRAYDTGAAGARTTFEMPAAEVVCGLPRTVLTSNPLNPRQVWWIDDADTALDCRWIDPGTGLLRALPFGFAYELTLTKKNAVSEGPESARVGFSRLGPPTAAPANVRLSPGS